MGWRCEAMVLRGVALGLALLVIGCGSDADDAQGSGSTETTGGGDVTDGDVQEPSDIADPDAADPADGAADDAEVAEDIPEDGADDPGPPPPDPGSDDGSPPPDDGPPPGPACESAEDAEILENAEILTVALGCAPGCLGQGPECAAACVAAETGLSADCAACAGAVTDCAVVSCGAQCLGGATPECASCVVGACGAAFQSCSGTTLPEPPPCTPECTDLACGPDGCGGSCGACEGGYCDAGACQAVVDGCASEDDEAAIGSSDPQAAAGDCGFQCIADPDITACAIACISAATGLSAGCAFCFGEQTGCSAQSCLLDCLDPTTPACKTCQATSCNPGFAQCAGIPFPGGQAPPACTGEADAAEIAALDAKTVLGDCATDCAGEPPEAGCEAGCIEAAATLTPECAGCWADASACLATTCAGDCAADATTPACASCVATSCAADFDACAGTSLVALFPCTPTCPADGCGDDGCGGTCGACGADSLCVDSICEPLEGAWCVNDPDEEALTDKDAAAISADCAASCAFSLDFGACAVDCFTTTIGLTAPCGICFANHLQCGTEQCGADCAPDPAAIDCFVCGEQSCGPAFEGCSGLVYGEVFPPP